MEEQHSEQEASAIAAIVPDSQGQTKITDVTGQGRQDASIEAMVTMLDGSERSYNMPASSIVVDLRAQIAETEGMRFHQVSLLSMVDGSFVEDSCTFGELVGDNDNMHLQMVVGLIIGPFFAHDVDIENLEAKSSHEEGGHANLTFYETDILEGGAALAARDPERDLDIYVDEPHYEDFNRLQAYRVLNDEFEWVRRRYQNGEGYPYVGKAANVRNDDFLDRSLQDPNGDVFDLVLHVPEEPSMATVCSFECPVTATYCISGLSVRKIVQGRMFGLKVYTCSSSDMTPTADNTNELNVSLPRVIANDGSWVRCDARVMVDLQKGDRIVFALSGWFDCGSARVSWMIEVF